MHQKPRPTHEELRRTIDNLRLELAKARRHNARLRYAQGAGRHARILDEALDNARLLALWHVAGAGISRRAAMAVGISQRKWEQAIALLRCARLLRGNSIETDDHERIEAALQHAYARQVASGNLDGLLARLTPAHRWR